MTVACIPFYGLGWHGMMWCGVEWSGVECSSAPLSSLYSSLYSSLSSLCVCEQDHCARVWIGVEQRPSHNAVADATISMLLFNAYRSVQPPTPYTSHLHPPSLD